MLSLKTKDLTAYAIQAVEQITEFVKDMGNIEELKSFVVDIRYRKMYFIEDTKYQPYQNEGSTRMLANAAYNLVMAIQERLENEEAKK
jgi:hypothetical protein